MLGAFTVPFRHAPLLARLVRREMASRYKGSFLGVAWTVLMPLFMIGIYAFVFGTVMQSRWTTGADQAESPYGFAMLLFAGFTLFNLFAETIARAPTLMLENEAYIKKIVFPLDILPWVVVICAAINFAVAFLVFLLLFVLFYGLPPVTILLLPFVVAPVGLIALGASFFLASIGVFLRDIRQIVPLFTTACLFLSPIFYPITAVPEAFQMFMALNPMTLGVVHLRDIVFWGQLPDPLQWFLYFAFGVVTLIVGHAWFMRTKKAFADVI